MELHRIAGLLLLRGIIWGIAGGLFGVVLLATQGHLDVVAVGIWPLPLATAVAGAVVGAFYSAKRVAIVGASVGSVAGIAYLITASSTPPGGLPVLGVCALAGLVAGGFSASALYEHREGALLVAVAGFLAGSVAGLFATVLLVLTAAVMGPFGLALLTAPLTGTLFIIGTLWLGAGLRVPLPQWLSVGLVSSGISGVVGLGLWALAATLTNGVEPAIVTTINETIDHVPQAFAGGLLGAAVAGMILEALSVVCLVRASEPESTAPVPVGAADGGRRLKAAGAAPAAWQVDVPTPLGEPSGSARIARASRPPIVCRLSPSPSPTRVPANRS
jgi:hypothetical protein